MPLGGRVFSFGKIVLLITALLATFVLFAGVAMRVALRTREVQVPALAGLTEAAAARSLASSGLTLRVDATLRPDGTVARGRVVQQDPPAGVAVRRQRTIRVWLSAGPRATSLANLVGQSERTARLRLEQDGITIGAISEIQSAEYPAGTVVAQDPPASVNTPRVTLLVNRGPGTERVVMPELIGLDGRRTAEALRSIGLRVSVTPATSRGGVPGAIISQSPSPGTPIGPGDAVSLEANP